jgi:hypothetical protein
MSYAPTYSPGYLSNNRVNFRTLGILWLVYGCLRIVTVGWLVIYSNTLVLMWGALLNRVPDALGWMAFFHTMLVLVLAWQVISAFFSFAAGFALMPEAASARTLGLVAAILALPEWPLGVALGAYSLVALLAAVPARPQAVASSPSSSSSSSRPATPLRVRESR